MRPMEESWNCVFLVVRLASSSSIKLADCGDKAVPKVLGQAAWEYSPNKGLLVHIFVPGFVFFSGSLQLLSRQTLAEMDKLHDGVIAGNLDFWRWNCKVNTAATPLANQQNEEGCSRDVASQKPKKAQNTNKWLV